MTQRASQDAADGKDAGLILSPGAGRPLPIGRQSAVIKEDGQRSEGEFAVVEIAVPPGTVAQPAHIHRRGGESWYVLDGELEVLAGGEQGRHGPGSFIMIPAGTPHRFANPGASTVRFLITLTPHQLGFLEALAELAAAGPPDPAALGAVMARFDTELVRPV